MFICVEMLLQCVFPLRYFCLLFGALHLSLSGFWRSPVCSNHKEPNFSDCRVPRRSNQLPVASLTIAQPIKSPPPPFCGIQVFTKPTVFKRAANGPCPHFSLASHTLMSLFFTIYISYDPSTYAWLQPNCPAFW